MCTRYVVFSKTILEKFLCEILLPISSRFVKTSRVSFTRNLITDKYLENEILGSRILSWLDVQDHYRRSLLNPISITVLLKLISNSILSTTTTLLHRTIVLLADLLHFYPPLNSTLYFVLITNRKPTAISSRVSYLLLSPSKILQTKNLNLIDLKRF